MNSWWPRNLCRGVENFDAYCTLSVFTWLLPRTCGWSKTRVPFRSTVNMHTQERELRQLRTRGLFVSLARINHEHWKEKAVMPIRFEPIRWCFPAPCVPPPGCFCVTFSRGRKKGYSSHYPPALKQDHKQRTKTTTHKEEIAGQALNYN